MHVIGIEKPVQKSVGAFLLPADGRWWAILIMLHTDNVYSIIVIREPWFTVRGIPFVLLQSGVAYLILRDTLKAHDKTFILIEILMIFAVLCFATVLDLGVMYPALQMLMSQRLWHT